VPHLLRSKRWGFGLELSMPKNLKRYYGLKHLHFITCSCYHRWPLLQTVHARNVFVQILSEVGERYGFALVGYVVMPNHIHLLIGEPNKGTPSTVMQVLKQRVSRRLRRAGRRRAPTNQLQLQFEDPGAQPPHFWQRRYHGFNVWSEKKWREKLEYMHLNPVKRKLVTDPKDWPWSSYPAYAGRGMVLTGIDFAGR
jgi:putative transposase